MKRMRIATVAAVAIASVALAGCSAGGADEADGGSGEGSTDTTNAVDTMFGEVEVPQPEDGELTVVALGWSDAEIALALGVQPVGVYDWQGFGEESNGVGPWASDLFDETPTIIENVGDALDYEAIQGLAPDVILNTRSAGDEAQFERLSEIAPTVYAPEGTEAFATAWDVQTEQVAAALGLADEGAALVEDVTGDIDAAREANPELEGLTAVSATKFGDAYGAYIAGDARWDILEDMGLTQNPGVTDLPSNGFYVSVSAEQVSAFDADVAVLFPIGYTLEELEADPLIAGLDVVTDDRAVLLGPDDEVIQALSAASPLSLPIAVEGLAPQLAEAAANAG